MIYRLFEGKRICKVMLLYPWFKILYRVHSAPSTGFPCDPKVVIQINSKTDQGFRLVRVWGLPWIGFDILCVWLGKRAGCHLQPMELSYGFIKCTVVVQGQNRKQSSRKDPSSFSFSVTNSQTFFPSSGVANILILKLPLHLAIGSARALYQQAISAP